VTMREVVLEVLPPLAFSHRQGAPGARERFAIMQQQSPGAHSPWDC
jgi:hypothetical protein